MTHASVLDREGLVRLFGRVAGRRFVGAVDGIDCVELVFDDSDGRGSNLVTVFTDRDPHRGEVWLGYVSQTLIDDGYGSDDTAEAPAA